MKVWIRFVGGTLHERREQRPIAKLTGVLVNPVEVSRHVYVPERYARQDADSSGDVLYVHQPPRPEPKETAVTETPPNPSAPPPPTTTDHQGTPEIIPEDPVKDDGPSA